MPKALKPPTYKIVAVIRGNKETLTGVGEPTIMKEMDSDLGRSCMAQDYVARSFRDKMQSLSDLTNVKYYEGRRILYQYSYIDGRSTEFAKTMAKIAAMERTRK